MPFIHLPSSLRPLPPFLEMLIQSRRKSLSLSPGRIKKYISPYRSPCVLGKGCPLPMCGFSIDNFLDILLPGSLPCVTTLRLCFTFRFSSMLCHCQRFLASPLRIRTLSCPLQNSSMQCHCCSLPLQALPCPCYLYVPLHSHAVAMLSINAPAVHIASTLSPSYSLPCNAPAVPGFSVQCLCFHTLCVALPLLSLLRTAFAVQICSELSLCSFMQYCALALQSEATALPSFALAHLVIALPLQFFTVVSLAYLSLRSPLYAMPSLCASMRFLRYATSCFPS